MWLWITIGLNFIATVHGYKDRSFPGACKSMSPVHHDFFGDLVPPQNPESSPFKITLIHGENTEPVTVILGGSRFRGFLLEARERDQVDNEGPPVGKFILIDSKTTHQECNGSPDSAVRHINHALKDSVRVNWTAPEEQMDITFRATFVQSIVRHWEGVKEDLTFPTTEPTTTTITATTTEPATTTITATTTEPATTATTTTTTEPTTTTITATTTEPTTTTITATTTEPATTATTTTTTEPATTTITATTTEPATTTTTEPTTTTSTTATTEPTTTTTTTTTTEPAITTSTTSTTESTTTSTREPTATSTTESTTTSTTEPPTPQSFCILFYLKAVVILTSVTSSMKQVHLTVIPSNNLPRPLKQALNVSWCVLCAIIETGGLILLNLGHCYDVILALVVVATVTDFIQLLINGLPLGPSHELKDICDLADKACSVIHEIFAVAIIFVGIQKISINKQTEHHFWILMISYAVWISLFDIWVFMSHFLSKSVHDAKWCRQRKRDLSRREKTLITASVFANVVAISFTAAITVYTVRYV